METARSVLTVEDVMNTRRVVSVRADDDVAFAARLMSWAGVRHLPVVEGEAVVGVFTERDYLRYRAEAGNGAELEPVSRFMSAPAQTVAPADPAIAASALLLGRHMGCLPVVADGTLVGIVTANDLLAADIHAAASPGALLKPEEPPRVRDVMTARGLLDVGEADSLAVAAHRMAWLRARHLPVTRHHEVVGVLSEGDILGWKANGRALDGPEDLVSAAMSAPAIVATPDEELGEAAARMIAARVDCLPVVVRGRLVGMLTSTDVLGHHVAQRFEQARSQDRSAAALMTPAAFTVSPGDPLLEAADIMASSGARHLPVVDEGGRLVGLLSEHDVRGALGVPSDSFDAWARAAGRDRAVREAMNAAVETVAPDQEPASVLAAMARRNVGALPVLDRAGRPIGVVSYLDVLRAARR